MKLTLAGYYGCGNLGDEAILESLITGIREMHPDADLTVLSGDPDATSQCYNVRAIKRSSIFGVIKSIKQSDALILGGGGLLQDITSKRSLRYYLSIIKLAKFFKKKTLLLGQGIGPVRGKRSLKSALRNVDLITVRDEASLKELADIGVRAKKIVLTADMALLAGKSDREKAEKLLKIDGVAKCRSRMIGVSLRPPVGGQTSTSQYKAIAAACDHLIKDKESQVVFLIFKYPEDMEISEKVMGFMKYHPHVFFRQCRPSDMISVISVLDAVIGMRLHSLIFAAKAGIPAFGLSYDLKVSSFQKIMGRPSVDFNGINESSLIREIDSFLDTSGKGSAGIELFEQKARLNFTYLDEVLMDKRTEVLGVKIDDLTMKGSMDKVKEFLNKRSHHLIVTPNPEMIMTAQNDVDLKSIINGASLAPADGVGLMMAGRLLGRRFRERVAGIDLMMQIVHIAKEKGLKIYLLGGKEGVAEAAAKNLDANVVGAYQGYSMNENMIIDSINKAKPDILFVGMGSPKQEKWASKHLKGLNVPLVMCVGGSLDVISGRVKRAPVIMRKTGFEWLWRLITEPKRWRRMLVLPKFILKVAASRF